MLYYLLIEDLASNAIIALLGAGREGRVAFGTLDTYGERVVEALCAGGDDAVLLLSRDRTRGFRGSCSDIFDIGDPSSGDGCISLRSGVTVGMLSDRFCGVIPIPVLRAMASDAAVDALLAAS